MIKGGSDISEGKKSFISCSSEAAAVSGDQHRGWGEGKNGETGRGQTEQVREVNARFFLSEKKSDPPDCCQNTFIWRTEGRQTERELKDMSTSAALWKVESQSELLR